MNASVCRSALATAAAIMALIVGSAEASTVVRFHTVLGTFDVQLFDDEMPNTVANFLGYSTAGRYDGTVIHRNSDSGGTDFVIQGGGFSFVDPTPPDDIISFLSVVNGDTPIQDEPGGGVPGPSNVRGTIAMAKSGPNTVTSQWFINQDDNTFLDDPDRNDGGFSAFGVVLGDGMEIVDAIGDLPLPNDFGFGISSPFNDLPLREFDGNSIQDIRVANTVTVTTIRELKLLPGDFDLDGDADFADLILLQNGFGMQSGAFIDDGDADMDGDVDSDDLAIWHTAFGDTAPENGDFNNSGTTDANDLTNWLAGLGTTFGATLADGDADMDTDVDLGDLMAWQRDFDATPAIGAIPEPTAAVLLALSALSLAALRRR